MSERDLGDYRREYALSGLSRSQLADDPMEQFKQWFADAEKAKLLDETAMVLSTASKEGKPSSRVVLLKKLDQAGFVFFTNYQSQKGQDITANAQVSLLFPWTSLERQIEISGLAEKISAEESNAYFQSRPRDSQIAAWASEQSRYVENRAALEQAIAQYQQQFEGKPISLPDFWGGYRVVPQTLEFWQGRVGRLHDRFEYRRDGDGWSIQRLAP